MWQGVSQIYHFGKIEGGAWEYLPDSGGGATDMLVEGNRWIRIIYCMHRGCANVCVCQMGGLLLFFPQITLSLKTQSMSSIRHVKQQWQVIWDTKKCKHRINTCCICALSVMGWNFGNGWNKEFWLIYLVMPPLLDYEEIIGEYRKNPPTKNMYYSTWNVFVSSILTVQQQNCIDWGVITITYSPKLH